MEKIADIARAIELLDEVDALIQGALDDCYDLYEQIQQIRDDIIDRARDEGIKVED
jgi:hypothetical protein